MGVTGRHAGVCAVSEQRGDLSHALMFGGTTQGRDTVLVRLVDIQSKLITKPANQLRIPAIGDRALKQGLALVATSAKIRAKTHQLLRDSYRRGLAKRRIQMVAVFDFAIYISPKLPHRVPDALYSIVVMQQFEDDRVSESRHAHHYRQCRQQDDLAMPHSSLRPFAVPLAEHPTRPMLARFCVPCHPGHIWERETMRAQRFTPRIVCLDHAAICGTDIHILKNNT